MVQKVVFIYLCIHIYNYTEEAIYLTMEEGIKWIKGRVPERNFREEMKETI